MSGQKKHHGVNLRSIGARITLNSIFTLLLTMFITVTAIYLLLTGYTKKYIMDELLAKAVTISELETNSHEPGIDPQHIKLYEAISGATVMYVDSVLMQVDYLTRTDDAAPVDIVQLGTPDESGEGLIRIYIWDTLERYVFKQILEGETIVDIRSFSFSAEDILFAGSPVRNSDSEIIGGIVLLQSTNVFDRQNGMILGVLVTVASVGIILTLVMSMLSSKRLTEPLVEITTVAQRMVEGHYGEIINVFTGTELDVLAGTLNTLTWRLDDVFKNLHQEQEKLKLVMNSLHEGLIAVDWYMNVIHCNQAFVQMMEMDCAPQKINENSDIGSALYKSMRGEKRIDHQWTNNSGRRLGTMASPFYGEGKLVIGAVCLVIDISESERMEQLRKNYVANISHELRTPLTGIRGMVEPLMDGIFETENERQDCYKVIYQETLRLEKLIQDMLDMSRLQDGRLTIEVEPLEVSGILKFAMRRVAKTAADAGINLKLDVDGENAVCIGNDDRILQVVTVFLDNAISFTPPGGEIVVMARNDGDNVRISVRDTGCGIEPKDVPYIWERFYKSDKSRMRTPGTGLGLAIAKLTVELMHGEIGVISEPGNGAEFWFTLKKG